MPRQAEQSHVAVGCQISCAPHRSDVWEKAKYLKEIIVSLPLALTSRTVHESIWWTSNASCYSLQMVAGCNWCNYRTVFQQLSASSDCIYWDKAVKQSIKAHQHPLIKVSLNNTWLSTSMGNQGTVVTLTSRWPKIDSKKRITDFTTETSNLAN